MAGSWSIRAYAGAPAWLVFRVQRGAGAGKSLSALGPQLRKRVELPMLHHAFCWHVSRQGGSEVATSFGGSSPDSQRSTGATEGPPQVDVGKKLQSAAPILAASDFGPGDL